MYTLSVIGTVKERERERVKDLRDILCLDPKNQSICFCTEEGWKNNALAKEMRLECGQS